VIMSSARSHAFYADVDFIAGVLFVIIGLVVLYVSSTYGFGAFSHLGPGFFPGLIGGVLAILGGLLAIRVLLTKSVAAIEFGKSAKPLAIIAAASIVYGFIIPYAGVIISTAVLTTISWFAYRERRLRELPFIILVLEVIIVGTFVGILGVPMKLGPF